ncbi:MAG: EamA family transporter [Archaeoglobaceae archaeon]
MKGEILALLAAILWGIAPILDRYALQELPVYPAIVIRAFGGFFAILLLSLVLKNLEISASKAIILLLVSGAISGAFAMILYFESLKIIGASRAVAITAAYPMITALLSVVFLSEGLSAKVALGILLIVIGIILVSEV